MSRTAILPASLALLALLLTGCAQQPADNTSPTYNSATSWQGQPNTGMENFTGTGANWGPGNDHMRPATPGSFKGY